MMSTVGRYYRYSFGPLEASQPGNNTQGNYQEYLKLKATVDVLQRSQRNFLGEDLSGLNRRELEQLEDQLETSLKQIRSTKTQSLLDQLADLQNREQQLLEANKSLKMKLDASNSQVPSGLAWEVPHTRLSAQSDGSSFRTLHIGYNPGADHEAAAVHSQHVNGFIPGWMI